MSSLFDSLVDSNAVRLDFYSLLAAPSPLESAFGLVINWFPVDVLAEDVYF